MDFFSEETDCRRGNIDFRHLPIEDRALIKSPVGFFSEKTDRRGGNIDIRHLAIGTENLQFTICDLRFKTEDSSAYLAPCERLAEQSLQIDLQHLVVITSKFGVVGKYLFGM